MRHLDMAERRGRVPGEEGGGGNAAGQLVCPRRFQAFVEKRADIFDSQPPFVASAPGSVMPSAIRDPEKRAGELARILEGEPDVTIESDRSPSEVLIGGRKQGQIFESFPDRILRQGSPPAVSQRNPVQRGEGGPAFQATVTANGGIFECFRIDLSVGDGTNANFRGTAFAGNLRIGWWP